MMFAGEGVMLLEEMLLWGMEFFLHKIFYYYENVLNIFCKITNRDNIP